jgi:hypothetical protein
MAGLAFYYEDYLNTAEEKIAEYYTKSSKTPDEKALMLLFKAQIEAKRGNYVAALQDANQAFVSAPAYVRQALYRSLANGMTIIDAFRDLGIFFVNDNFSLATKTN